MSRAVLLVDHGSRNAEANALLECVAEELRRRLPGDLVHVAHLELAEPSIGEGIDACVAGGATEIVVHPYFLGPGVHTRRDIPEIVRAAAEKHTGLRVAISEPLGFHEKLVDVVLERVQTRRA